MNNNARTKLTQICGNSNLAPTMPQPERQPQVDAQICQAQNRLGENRVLIEQIQDRLRGVLRDSVPEPCDKTEEAEYLVPVASTLRDANHELRAQGNLLASILERIEC